MTVEEARKLLTDAGLFYGDDDPEEPDPKLNQTLNMNDVWGWAMACGEYVADEELVAVAELFYCYGWCGVLYWMSEKHNGMQSEFVDNNRFIEFVRQEERIKKELPGSTERAYGKRQYTIGVSP